MAESSSPKTPRTNPFWAYRDPSSGKWVTLMTSDQWQQSGAQQAFQPQIRQPRPSTSNNRDTHWPQAF